MPQPLNEAEFAVGHVLGESTRLYGDFFVRLLALSLVVFGPIDVVSFLLSRTNSTALLLPGVAFVLLANLIGFFWLQAVLVVQTDDFRDGRIDMTIRQNFRRTWPFVGRLAAFAVGLGVAVAAPVAFVLVAATHYGLLFLGIPVALVWAVCVAVRLYLVPPLLVLEHGRLLDAVRRSNELVDEDDWGVLRLLAVTTGTTLLLGAVVRGIAGQSVHGPMAAWIGAAVSDLLTVPFAGVVATVAYFALSRTAWSPAAGPAAPAVPASEGAHRPAHPTPAPPPARLEIPPGAAYRDE